MSSPLEAVEKIERDGVAKFAPGPQWELNGLRFVETDKAQVSTESYHVDDFPAYGVASEMFDALKAAQAILTQLIKPDMKVAALHIFAQAVEAETKARSAIAKARGA